MGRFLGALLLLAPKARAQGVVAVHIWNPGAFEERVLRSAEAVVDLSYQRAGLTLAWRHCAAGADDAARACAAPQGPNEVSIRFVDHRDEGRSLDADRFGGRAVPLEAWPGSGFVYVYGDRVQQVSGEGRIRAGIVLGTILSHEIGHLLLPRGHSAWGIMRARIEAHEWQLAERGCLRFTPSETAALRACGQRGQALHGGEARARLALGAFLELLP